MISLESVYNHSGYIKILYDLLKERTPEQSISHKEMPNYVQHAEFVNSRPYFRWYFILYEDQIVGSVYLTYEREIGIFIFNRFKRRGFGEQAVRMLMSTAPGKFLANVNPQNEASRKLFEKLGGQLIQVTYELKS